MKYINRLVRSERFWKTLIVVLALVSIVYIEYTQFKKAVDYVTEAMIQFQQEDNVSFR